MFDTALEFAQVGDIHFALRPGFIVQRTDGAMARVLKTEGHGKTFAAYVEWATEHRCQTVEYGVDGRPIIPSSALELAGVWKAA